ncbi:P-loop containing nucleoside triphosphate hydrolase protein, partial [Mycena filopes]
MNPPTTETRLNNISKSLSVTTHTLELLVETLKFSALEAISNTTQSLAKLVLTIKQNKEDCAELMEHTSQLLAAVVDVYLKSDNGGEDLAPSVLNQIGNLTTTLHKIHTFIEAQQTGNKLKIFFQQGELGALLKSCKADLQHELAFFSITTVNILANMQARAEAKHQEVLNLIETLSSSDSASSISKMYSGSFTSSTSISMLPASTQIFHGRESELADILKLFNQGTPRIAILGAGGMGKTSLAKAVLHEATIAGRYTQYRFFIPCDKAGSKVELAALIGAHLGLKPGMDMTRAVLQYLRQNPPSLLVLDNLETVWEPVELRKEIEEFLSLLTDIITLSLMVTMRGAERPSKVQWTRPFLLPLRPLAQDAAQKVFWDIADDGHMPDEINQVLQLTDNVPLAICLLAHLVDVEGCSTVLSRWQTEKTSVISDGHDKRSNMELSISISLSSPRITSIPDARDLLSLMGILPDGLSDAELRQAKFPLRNILGCKDALVRTALAYIDEHKRLKVLVPIREYMQKLLPATNRLIKPLLCHFQELLEVHTTHRGQKSG